MRKLISDAAFVVFITWLLAGLAALVFGARVVAGLCALAAVAAYAVAWLAAPGLLDEAKPCPTCLGTVWLPTDARSIEECQTCRDHPGLAS
jgi:hypothetical protein